MNIFFYNDNYRNSDEKIDQVRRIVHNKSKKSHIINIHKPEDLKERLENFLSPEDLVVLIAHDKEELQDILPAQELLKDVRVILLLTQREIQMVELSQYLSPRFVGFLEDEFTELKPILTRIIKEKVKKQSFSDPQRYTNWGVRSIL